MANKENNAPAPAAPADLVTQIGTLTYPRAVENFGKDRAVAVIQQVALIGGHGFFDEAEIKSPLFGGLAMPDPAKVMAPRDEEFPATMPDREFHIAAAHEEYEGFKKKAAADRAKINEFFNTLK